MPKSTAINTPVVFITRNLIDSPKRSYLIALHKPNMPRSKRHAQKIATLHTICADDLIDGIAYARKWFGITDKGYD